jgi:hypothetical protein
VVHVRHALLALPNLAFLFLSLMVSMAEWREAGWSEGLSAMAASLLAMIAGSGLRAANKQPLFRESGVRGFAAFFMLIAFWLSMDFSVHLFGVDLSGKAWVAIGLFISLLFTTTNFARRIWMLDCVQGS